MKKTTQHRLTWRGYCAVTVEAETREMAIAIAIEQKPNHIPAGTELHYGIVGNSASAVYRVEAKPAPEPAYPNGRWTL